MLYITNVTNISQLEGLEQMQAEDHTVVFCKENDSIKVSDVGILLKTPGSAEMIPVDGREDMLICLGGLISSADECTVLDPGIPIPKRYEEKVHSPLKGTKKTVRRRRKEKKEPGSAEPLPMDTTSDSVEETVTEAVKTENVLPGMPLPVADGQMADTAPTGVMEVSAAVNKPAQPMDFSGEVGSPVFKRQDTEAMYKLLSIRSSDIGFSWPPEMLMARIISYISQSSNDAELQGNIRAINNGDKIWKVLEPKLSEAKKIIRS